MAMANTARRALRTCVEMRLAFSPAATATIWEASSTSSSLFGRELSVVVESSAPHYLGMFERSTFGRQTPMASFKCSSAGDLRRIATDTAKITQGVGEVNDATFKELVLESDIPVLVDFWAPWCGPCRMIAPVIEELARQYAGKLKCFKLNTDENPDVSAEYAIRSIPTIMIFVRGEKKDAVMGAVPKSTLAATVDKYLGV